MYNCWKTWGSLWQYWRDEPDLNNDGGIINFINDSNDALFKFQQKTAVETGSNGTKDKGPIEIKK